MDDWAKRLAEERVPLPALGERLGFRLVALREGEAEVAIDTDAGLHNTEGTVHGGVLCAIADTAMGFAYQTTLPEGTAYTTVELKINFLRPVTDGPLRAVARLIKPGRTVGVAECDILAGESRLIARASCTCLVLPSR